MDVIKELEFISENKKEVHPLKIPSLDVSLSKTLCKSNREIKSYQK